MTLTANWSYPTGIRFGAGRISELPEACTAAGIKNPLLVTDKGLAALPITQSTLDIMAKAGLGRAIFADVDPNPNEINVVAGLEAYRAGQHDGVVAFGGGSGLDLGKQKNRIIQSGYKAVEELIKVAEEEIIVDGAEDELAADRLKNAAATKKLAIFDAFEILNRIELEKAMLENKTLQKEEKSFSGFAEKRSK